MPFPERMAALTRAFESQSYAQALAMAWSLKAQLLEAPMVDPAQLGWVRYYEFRCYYRLGRDLDGLTLLDSPEPRPYHLSLKNAAWMHSVGAELAARLGLPERALDHGLRALELRLADGDRDGAQMAAETTAAVLRDTASPELLELFADQLAAMWTKPPAGSREAMDAALVAAMIFEQPWMTAMLPSGRRRSWERLLHAAASDGDLTALDALLKKGASPNGMNPCAPGLPTPLIAAAFNGHGAVVRRLLDLGVDLEAVNVQGRTALHQASDQGHAGIVRLLLEAGADADRASLYDHTPLHIAAWQDHFDVVKALLAAKARVDSVDVNGDTPLALAATEAVPDVVQALLEAGASVEQPNHYGQTPLVRAAMSGQDVNVRLLRAAGADLGRVDHNGMGAKDWAAYEGHEAVIRALG
ncbi:MAG: ankyrin repeat domain-containing protein [Alphaproteobacteria bacterium]|nr:ankyrin repeat domain-containing protein [Alphaproteobacteria bacterium]